MVVQGGWAASCERGTLVGGGVQGGTGLTGGEETACEAERAVVLAGRRGEEKVHTLHGA